MDSTSDTVISDTVIPEGCALYGRDDPSWFAAASSFEGDTLAVGYSVANLLGLGVYSLLSADEA